MNAPISRLLLLLLALFATVVGFTSYWSVIDAENLKENPENRRILLEEAQIARGEIRSADGELIAESVETGEGERAFFERRYPLGDLFGHPVGYYFLDRGRSGIELAHDDELTGRKAEFISIIDQLEGQAREGSDITLTINAAAQRTAYEALGGQIGAVVAIEPATGAVRVMASNPAYDPAGVQDDQTFKAFNQDENAPLLNRATQSGYEPGSTMKIVTATAALDSGEFTPETTLNGDTGIPISGVPLENAGGESFGEISMTDALTNSVNTYWAQVGEQLGSGTMLEYMDRFGFNEDPPIVYPPGELNPSGIYDRGRLLTEDDSIDIGRVAIGQERLLVTPLQMAMVAATVANGGKLIEPTFLQAITDPDGRTTEKLDSDVASTVMSEETAATVTEMMTNVTEEGTAAGLNVPGAPEFAGKTGTAEIDVEAGINRGWFVAFAPTDDPQVAVAAVIERTSGFGGETAGPVATEVMGALLNQ